MSDVDSDPMVQHLCGMIDYLSKKINENDKLEEEERIRDERIRDLKIAYSRAVYYLKKIEKEYPENMPEKLVDEIMDDVYQFFDEEEIGT